MIVTPIFMDDDYLSELSPFSFASLPADTERVLTIGEYPVFSSNDLKEKFIQAFYKSSRGKHVAPKVEKMVRSGIILPCYFSKNLFGFLKHKAVGGFKKHIMAMYSVEHRKILVFIDNNVSLFGFGSTDNLIATTMHETMHLVTVKSFNQMVTVTTPMLAKFYTAFLQHLFRCDSVPREVVKKYIQHLFRLEKFNSSGRGSLPTLLYQYRQILDLLRPYSRRSTEDFNFWQKRLLVACLLMFKQPKVVFSTMDMYAEIFTALSWAYAKGLGKENKLSTPIQEIVYPSEVVAMYVELMPSDPLTKKLFNLI